MKKILFTFSILFIFSSTFAQKSLKPDLKKLSKEEVKKYDNAELFFSENNYLRALPIFVDLLSAHPEDTYFKLRAAICYLSKSDEKNKAIPLLKEVQIADPQNPELNFYLGSAYHFNY